jgi:hypothetical protein
MQHVQKDAWALGRGVMHGVYMHDRSVCLNRVQLVRVVSFNADYDDDDDIFSRRF